MRALYALLFLLFIAKPGVASGFDDGFGVGTWRAAMTACGLTPDKMHLMNLERATANPEFVKGYVESLTAAREMARAMREADPLGFNAVCIDLRNGQLPIPLQ